MFSDGLFSWKGSIRTEWVGCSVCGSWFPPGGQDCAELLSYSWHRCVPPPFSWWTWESTCPWRPWAAPWRTAHTQQSWHRPIMSHRNLVSLQRRYSRGCVSACSRSRSPCGPCWGPYWPLGSTEPQAVGEGSNCFLIPVIIHPSVSCFSVSLARIFLLIFFFLISLIF